MKKRLFSLFCLLGTVAGLFAGDTAYLFSYFINDSRDGLHLAYSLDGLTWTPLNHGKSFLIPTPCRHICRGSPSGRGPRIRDRR